MSTKDWKNNEIQGLLAESWGFSMNLDNLTEEAKPDFIDLDSDGDKEESMKKAAQDKKEKEGDKENMEEGGCAPMGDETAMMVVDDQPDMYGDEPEMDAMDDSLEGKLDMILSRLDSLLSMEKEEEEEEEEELEEIIDTSPDAEDRGRGKKEEDDEEDLDERRARGRDREGMQPDARRRPMEEQKLREAVRKALRASIKKA